MVHSLRLVMYLFKIENTKSHLSLLNYEFKSFEFFQNILLTRKIFNNNCSLNLSIYSYRHIYPWMTSDGKVTK